MTRAISISCPACGKPVDTSCACQARITAAAKVTRDENANAKRKARQ